MPTGHLIWTLTLSFRILGCSKLTFETNQHIFISVVLWVELRTSHLLVKHYLVSALTKVISKDNKFTQKSGSHKEMHKDRTPYETPSNCTLNFVTLPNQILTHGAHWRQDSGNPRASLKVKIQQQMYWWERSKGISFPVVRNRRWLMLRFPLEWKELPLFSSGKKKGRNQHQLRIECFTGPSCCLGPGYYLRSGHPPETMFVSEGLVATRTILV